MNRYSVINEKNRREIVLLRGSGCAYKKCRFCDYHTDSGADVNANYAINSEALEKVTGEFGDLEVINSGSVFELDGRTLELIKKVCAARGIGTIHFEAHYMYRNRIVALRREFSDFDIKMKLGLETFDRDLRENVLKKGIPETNPRIIGKHFDEANFLFGIAGQTARSMLYDIETGLKFFERICVNIMCENSTAVAPNADVISCFMREVYPRYKDDQRVDILLRNTDFGVGGLA
ncbi:MAG: radical SAM protein [Roseburia sp.]|nr:radical SAM protein [Roseburia sp.]